MKKSLIALAVIGAFTAQSAMADGTTIYGSANVSFDAVSNGGQNTAVPLSPASASANAVASNASRLGFKGSEDLGDGLAAIWQIEEQINFASSGGINNTNAGAGPTNGTTNFTARDTFAGLSSGTIGTLIMGIHDTPYKMATRGADVFADTIADNRSIMGTNFQPNLGAAVTTGDLRLNNVVAYIAPAFSGLTLAIATISGAEIPQSNGTKGSAWSLAALYGNGPWNADFGYQKITIGSAGNGTLGGLLGLAANDTATDWKVGGGYTVDQFAVNLVYEKEAASTSEVGFAGIDGGNVLDRASWYLSGKFNVTPNDAIKAAYTSAGNVAAQANSGAKQFSIGYDHNLSKHTTVYALYSKLTNDTNAGYALGNADATSNISSNGGIGADPSVFSLGMKHAF